MRILIIGGTGVLSSAVAKEALKQGIDVTMINRGRRKELIPQGVELITSDKDDKQTIQKALKGKNFDAVMDYLCYTDEETTKSFNLYSQYTKQYFFISSCAVYNTSLNITCYIKPISLWRRFCQDIEKVHQHIKMFLYRIGLQVSSDIFRFYSVRTDF